MRNKILIALLAAFAAIPALAQGPPVTKQTAQEYDTAPFVPAPTVPNASAGPLFLGNATCYYWIITRTPGPPAAISAPLSLPLVGSCPSAAGGTAQNPVSISWGTVPNATYDVLETTTSTMPVGTNTVAIVTNSISTNLTDTGQARSSYTLLPAGLNWQEFNNLIAGIPTLQFCYNGNCPFGLTPTGTIGGATVTSVGVAVQTPPQLTDTITGSPVTTAGTITILEQWNPVPNGYVFSGGGTNSIGGIFDGSVGNGGSSTAPTATINVPPSPNNHELAFNVFSTQNLIQSGPPTMPGGWISQTTNGNFAGVFSQVFTGTTPITAPVTLTTSDAWTDFLFLLRLPAGNPSFVQKVTGGGAFTTTTNVFPGNVTAGNSVLIVACWPTSTSAAKMNVVDALLNIYTSFGQSAAGGPFCAAALTANILGGTTDAVTITASGVSGNGFFYQQELSNLAASNGTPIFQPIANLGISSGPPVTSFTNSPAISANVTINNTNTTIATRSVTMPATGCPCRAFLSYSLYLDFTGVTNQPNIDFWVSDGTNVMAGLETGQSNAATGAKTSATFGGYSNGTYANGAAITFTLIGIQPGTAGATVQAAPHTGSGPNSSFQVVISSSN